MPLVCHWLSCGLHAECSLPVEDRRLLRYLYLLSLSCTDAIGALLVPTKLAACTAPREALVPAFGAAQHAAERCSCNRALTSWCALQLAVEAIFLEAVQRLAPPAGSGLSVKQADALQHLAFDWILYADKYVDPRFQELAVYRDQVAARGRHPDLFLLCVLSFACPFRICRHWRESQIGINQGPCLCLSLWLRE